MGHILKLALIASLFKRSRSWPACKQQVSEDLYIMLLTHLVIWQVHKIHKLNLLGDIMLGIIC